MYVGYCKGPLKDILISFSIFLTCLIVAMVSQIISPTELEALEIPAAVRASNEQAAKNPSLTTNLFELDPEEVNPILFAMAPEKKSLNADALGGPISKEAPLTTPSGLSITELVIGNGEEAKPGQTVSVNYRGTLENGQEFDSSYGRGPFNFPLGAGRVIKGWDVGVSGMKVGGKRKLIIPPDLGYGNRGAGNVIPPNATLVFEVELLEII